jgi:hypothetical protein
MRTEARFPAIGRRAGHYESFYLKTTRPGGGRGVWIRHTVAKRPGAEPTASLWFTLFDADAPGPRAAKVTVGAGEVRAPVDAYIEVGAARLEPGHAAGELSAPDLHAAWELDFEPGPAAFDHLPYSFMYRAPVPRTKFRSPYPDTRFSGSVTVDGQRFELDSWPGMIGHDWGAEHAERWAWIQANEFRQGEACFDAALGRIKVGPFTTPWIGNALLRVDGTEHRLGGLDRIRSTRVDERPTACDFRLAGRRISVSGRIRGEPREFVAWIYADPKGPEHNTLNCSISDLELIIERDGHEARRLACVGAAAYEIGMRETDHGIAVQSYPDG